MTELTRKDVVRIFQQLPEGFFGSFRQPVVVYDYDLLDVGVIYNEEDACGEQHKRQPTID